MKKQILLLMSMVVLGLSVAHTSYGWRPTGKSPTGESPAGPRPTGAHPSAQFFRNDMDRTEPFVISEDQLETIMREYKEDLMRRFMFALENNHLTSSSVMGEMLDEAKYVQRQRIREKERFVNPGRKLVISQQQLDEILEQIEFEFLEHFERVVLRSPMPPKKAPSHLAAVWNGIQRTWENTYEAPR